jgi:Protein of unknown function (DUF3990)
MSTLPPNVPNSWYNQKLVLFHGTIDTEAPAIVAKVDISKGRRNTDFGRGFYTTTILRQAKSWAWTRTQRKPGSKLAVVRLEIERDALAGLQALWFVRGSFDAEDFWSLIFHCRNGNKPHGRKAHSISEYDVVIGPAAASWKQRLAIHDADQVSFHTPAAEALLNGPKCSRSILP